MEQLILTPASTLFARLVAIRIKVSAFLSGLNYNLDRNYQRLLQQQKLCIRAMKKKLTIRKDNTHTFMMSPLDYKKQEYGLEKFNTILGGYK